MTNSKSLHALYCLRCNIRREAFAVSELAMSRKGIQLGNLLADFILTCLLCSFSLVTTPTHRACPICVLHGCCVSRFMSTNLFEVVTYRNLFYQPRLWRFPSIGARPILDLTLTLLYGTLFVSSLSSTGVTGSCRKPRISRNCLMDP